MTAHKSPFIEPFCKICLDEGAPYSVTEWRRWPAYLSRLTVPDETHKLLQVQSSFIFCGNRPNIVKFHTVAKLNIHLPLPDYIHLLYQSFIIHKDTSLLLGLNVQCKLQALIDKDDHSPTITLHKISIK